MKINQNWVKLIYESKDSAKIRQESMGQKQNKALITETK